MDSLLERCFFDADDIDRIVRTQTLSEIDQEILQAAITSCDRQLSPSMKTYWIDRCKAFQTARNIAEYCFQNNIPTNEKADTKRELGLLREKRLQELILANRELQQQVQGLNKALANHLATKPKKVSQTQTPIIRTIGI